LIVKALEALGQAVEKMAAYDSHLCFRSQVPVGEAYRNSVDQAYPLVEVDLETAAASSAGLVVQLANCHLASYCLAEREP
jgi:hypothetical protein